VSCYNRRSLREANERSKPRCESSFLARTTNEGTDVTESAMQAYLDWEYGLLEQLRRDGAHGVRVT
jgi:hypothetical protein